MHVKEKKWYSCMYDRCFKSVVVDEKDYSIMEAILSTILEEPIQIIAYHITEMKVNSLLEKVRIADVLIELHGEYIHIEVETGTGLETKIKNFTTFTTFYNQNIVRGESYDTITKFLHITLQFGEGTKKPLKSCYTIYDEENNELFLDNIHIFVINMDKLKSMWDNGIEKDKYKYLIMLFLTKEELETFEREDEIVAKFKKKITKLNESPKFQAMMDYEERQKLEQNTAKHLAFLDGESSGFLKGEEKGRKQQQLSVAKEMLQDGVSIENILKYTSLSLEEIKKL